MTGEGRVKRSLQDWMMRLGGSGSRIVLGNSEGKEREEKGAINSQKFGESRGVAVRWWGGGGTRTSNPGGGRHLNEEKGVRQEELGFVRHERLNLKGTKCKGVGKVPSKQWGAANFKRRKRGQVRQR